MLRRIRAVALNTYRETVRDRIFYLVGLFGLGYRLNHIKDIDDFGELFEFCFQVYILGLNFCF